jgi:hypothetical protein
MFSKAKDSVKPGPGYDQEQQDDRQNADALLLCQLTERCVHAGSIEEVIRRR